MIDTILDWLTLLGAVGVLIAVAFIFDFLVRLAREFVLGFLAKVNLYHDGVIYLDD